MSFFRAVIYLLIRSKIYQYIAYQRTAGNQLRAMHPQRPLSEIRTEPAVQLQEENPDVSSSASCSLRPQP